MTATLCFGCVRPILRKGELRDEMCVRVFKPSGIVSVFYRLGAKVDIGIRIPFCVVCVVIRTTARESFEIHADCLCKVERAQVLQILLVVVADALEIELKRQECRLSDVLFWSVDSC